ncbi:MAG TPA: exo-alpha-sialidase, partial [Spirochaetes bacterium]|nr:exo-alpha-sialidase [Spirochaetota bacterium]
MKGLISKIFGAYFRFPYLRQALWTGLGGLLAVAVILAVSVTSRVSTLTVGWEKDIAVSPAGVDAGHVHVASRGNLIAMTYEGDEQGQKKIYVSLSFNGGKSFLDPVIIAEVGRSIDHLPRVAVSANGHVAVVWQNLVKEESNSRVYYAVSTDMGATWTSPVRLFLNTTIEMLPQALYDDRNRLHLFFHGHREGAFNLFHCRSDDEKTFGKPYPLVNMGNLRGAFFPAIYSSGSDMYLVWQGKGDLQGVLSDDLYAMVSGNYGKSWSNPRRITVSRANDAAPSIAIFRDTIYCVYQNNDDNSWSIKMLRGYNRGVRWDEVPTVVSDTNANCYAPSIVRGRDDELVVLWYDTRDVEPGIMARKYLAAEGRFSPVAKLSREKTPARSPVGVTAMGRVIALWQEGRRIIAKYSDIHVDPPVVYSRTHPEDRWSKLPDAQIEWRPPADESGVAGYAVFVNRDPEFIPSVQNLDGNVRAYRVPSLEDGITYFHIRAVDGAGNYSRPLHYKLQVSRTPLPMPVVISPTHPEATAVNQRRSVVRWSIGQKERLKGFVYGIGRGTVVRPDNFTTGFETVFDNLEDGRYFISVAAIDRVNTPGRVATYEIIVNKAEPVDKSLYDRIAKGLFLPPGKEAGTALPAAPMVGVEFPFDPKKPYGQSAFTALLVPRNMNRNAIDGYSVEITAAK